VKRVYVRPTPVIDKTAVRGDGIKVWHFVRAHTLMTSPFLEERKLASEF